MTRTAAEPRRIVSASVSSTDAERLRELARAADRSTSAELRRALREHLARAEKETTAA